MKTHGILATRKAGCTCEPCLAAGRRREWIRRERYDAERVLIDGRLVAPVSHEMHGRESTYCRRGCRCERCTAAHGAPRRARKGAA